MVDDVRKRPDDELNFTEGTEEVRCVAESPPSVLDHSSTSTATLLFNEPNASSLSKRDVGAIAGASVSGVVFISVVAVLVWCFRRHRPLSSPPCARLLSAFPCPSVDVVHA